MSASPRKAPEIVLGALLGCCAAFSPAEQWTDGDKRISDILQMHAQRTYPLWSWWPPALWVVTKRSQTVACQQKTRSESGHAVFMAALDSMENLLPPSFGAVLESS